MYYYKKSFYKFFFLCFVIALCIDVFFPYTLYGKAKKSKLPTLAPTTMSIQNKSISIGDSITTLQSRFGKPDRIDKSIYPFDYYVYNTKTYKNFFMIGVQHNKVVAFYTDAASFQIGCLTPKCSIRTVNNLLNCKLPSDCNYTFLEKDGLFYQLFFDQFNQKKLMGVLLSSVELSQTRNRTNKILRSEEREIFDTCNSARVRYGLPPLRWSKQTHLISLQHSQDMILHDFFDHTSSNGTPFFKRISKTGTRFHYAGENIICGFEDGLSANNGWLNSLSHRVNILGRNFTHSSIGGAAGGTSHIYFTQDFYG